MQSAAKRVGATMKTSWGRGLKKGTWWGGAAYVAARRSKRKMCSKAFPQTNPKKKTNSDGKN